MSKPPFRKTAPFAVIELIAIVAILGILVVITLPMFTKPRPGSAPMKADGKP